MPAHEFFEGGEELFVFWAKQFHGAFKGFFLGNGSVVEILNVVNKTVKLVVGQFLSSFPEECLALRANIFIRATFHN
jgi:hypothetical protein